MAYFRKSTQTVRRPYSHLDGQVYRINRGKAERSPGGRTVYTPLPSHWREASCGEVNCPHWEHGWVTTLDLGPDQPVHELQMNQTRAKYIREQSGRAFTERWEGSTVIYTFQAEQKCFRQHKLPVARDPIFVHLPGVGMPAKQVDDAEFFTRFNETSYWLGRRLNG